MSMDSYSAILSVLITGKGNHMSFVQSLPECKVKRIMKNYRHHYDDFVSDPYAMIYKIDEHSFGVIISELGQGDLWYGYVFYTDNQGIDHLVQESCSCFGEDVYAFFGDRVIGLHENCPIVYENSYNINSKTKTLLGFSQEITDVVIPDGIERIGYQVFWNRPDLRSIYIPDSVPNNVLSNPLTIYCPNLKYIYVSRNRKIGAEEERGLLKGCPYAKIHRLPENVSPKNI